MKNFFFIVVTFIAIVATLNSLGIVNAIPKITRSDNPAAETGSLDMKCIPDTPITKLAAQEYYEIGKAYIASSGVKLKREYFLSRYTINHLMEKSNGIVVSPTIIDGEIMFIAFPATEIKCDQNNDVPTDFGYVIKTYCPEVCENSL